MTFVMPKGQSKPTKDYTDLKPLLNTLEPTLRDQVVLVDKMLTRGVVQALKHQPFFSVGMLNMPIKIAKVGRGCTDGKTQWYDPAFVVTLTNGQVVFLLCHEVMHKYSFHQTRRGDRHPKLWNIAGDHFINLQLWKVIQEEREKQKKIKIQAMQREKIEAQKRFKQQEELAIKAKAIELREEEKLGRERKIELQKFIRLEQAELRKERAEKQRKFLEQIALEKKIEQFRKREALEIKNLEKYVLSQQRESYEEVQQRIERIKEKYRSLREQKVNEAIRERVAQLGIKIEDTDNKETLLEKERIYNQEREKIEYALESFYRSAHSLCFQINKRYIPKYLSILRLIDRRFETSEIFIKWDDAPDEEWLILIYLKNNSPDAGIIIEDKTDPERKISHEFKSNEIF